MIGLDIFESADFIVTLHALSQVTGIYQEATGRATSA
jgi:hypothetical protein